MFLVGLLVSVTWLVWLDIREQKAFTALLSAHLRAQPGRRSTEFAFEDGVRLPDWVPLPEFGHNDDSRIGDGRAADGEDLQLFHSLKLDEPTIGNSW